MSLLLKNKSKSFFLLIYVIFILLIINYQNSAYSEINPESKIIERLDKIEKDMISLQRQFYRNNKSSDDNSDIMQNSRGNIAEIDAKINDIEEKTRIINGNIEQLQYENKKQQQLLSEILEKQNAKQAIDLNQKIQEDQASKNKKTELRINQSAIKELPTKDKPKILGEVKIKNINKNDKENKKLEISEIQNTDDKKDDDNASIKEIEPKELFDQSFAYLKASKLGDAEKGFIKFITKYKDHDLIGNAYYWLGETYFIRKDYKQAGVNFVKSYKSLSRGPKAHESLMKLAISFSYLNKQKEACSVINKLDSLSNNLSNNLKKRMNEESKRIGCNINNN